jgi:hypothetical protein
MPATSAPTRFDGGTATATGTASAATSGGERVFTAFDGGAGNLPTGWKAEVDDDGFTHRIWVDEGEELEHDDW